MWAPDVIGEATPTAHGRVAIPGHGGDTDPAPEPGRLPRGSSPTHRPPIRGMSREKTPRAAGCHLLPPRQLSRRGDNTSAWGCRRQAGCPRTAPRSVGAPTSGRKPRWVWGSACSSEGQTCPKKWEFEVPESGEVGGTVIVGRELGTGLAVGWRAQSQRVLR